MLETKLTRNWNRKDVVQWYCLLILTVTFLAAMIKATDAYEPIAFGVIWYLIFAAGVMLTSLGSLKRQPPDDADY